MRPRALIVTFTSALAATLAVAAPSPAVTRSARPQTLLFDAVATNARTAGPDADHVGHEQIAGGALRDAAGHRVGHYAFTCRWIQILGNGDARERCAGWGQTADGRLDFAGFTRSSAATHTFTTTGGTRRYRGVRGVLVTRDLGLTESLITATMTPRHGSLLRVGTVPRPPADARFGAHANRLCRAPPGKSRRCRRSRSRTSTHSAPTQRSCHRSAPSSPAPAIPARSCALSTDGCVNWANHRRTAARGTARSVPEPPPTP